MNDIGARANREKGYRATSEVSPSIEVQSEYAKSAFEDYSAQLEKFGRLYADLTKGIFKPIEVPMAKASPKK